MRLPLLLLFAAAFSSAHALTFEMKPGGAIPDLAAARDAARKARAEGVKEPITVRIADGAYPLLEAVVFEPQDSGVTYEAAPGAKPVFTGGRQITGFQPGSNGVWTARVDPKW